MKSYQASVELRTVKVARIKTNPVQSSSRTKHNKMTSLVAAIKGEKCMLPPIVDKDMMLVDGHRRLAALITLGAESVTVLVLGDSVSPPKLVAINRPTLAFNGRHKLEAWAQDPKYSAAVLGELDGNCRTRIERLVAWLGAKRTRELVQLYEKFQPGISDMAAAVAAMPRVGNAAPHGTIVEWLLKNGFFSPIALKEFYSPSGMPNVQLCYKLTTHVDTDTDWVWPTKRKKRKRRGAMETAAKGTT